MLSLRIRRAAAVVVLVAASTLIPLPDLHAASREQTRKEKPVKVRAVAPAALFGKLISVLWEAAGLRIDDNGLLDSIREAAGLRIDDNG